MQEIKLAFQTDLFSYHEPQETFAYKNFEIICSKQMLFV